MLPHLQQAESKTPLECVEWLVKGRDDEVYLAVSADFYDVDDSVDYPAIYAAYQQAYQDYIRAFNGMFGAPKLSVAYGSPEYPPQAVGVHVTLWESHRGPFWLRLQHDDRECPIMIVLAVGLPAYG